MRRRLLDTAFALVSLGASFAIGPGHAADLVWQVENPFRFFKSANSFALHAKAFSEVRGNPAASLPADIVWRLERRLNDPDCKDATTPTACAVTARNRYAQSRLGWAAQTIGAVCYESSGNPRRYPAQCERKYSWGVAKEDYILPAAHTVSIGLSPERLAAAGAGECTWSWRPRAGVGRIESRKQPCKTKLTIARVPYSRDRAVSGVAVSVKLPDGHELSEPEVIVEDVLIAALGDSFASGESNPDRPVTFSASREMLYDPSMLREDVAARQKTASVYSIASGNDPDPRVLPRRRIEDEDKDIVYKLTSREFLAAFERGSARWLSADCHRSQYGYPFRVGLQLTLENRHRSVTLVSLACSGAEVTEGLFLGMKAREGKPDTVRAQFDQLSDLICRGGAAARTRSVNYTLPFYRPGGTALEPRQVTQRWCPPEQRKRPLDLVLMSIGGNDVGFGGLAAYAMTERASDLAPIVGWVGQEIRYSPATARVYLGALDRRLQAVKLALRDGFGVEPARVVQSAYEPVQYDETGALCGATPTLGMDVHPKLMMSRQRVAETADFMREFLTRLECASSVSRRADCPANLATGAGTGFRLVTEHLAKFAKRGICARDPARALSDGIMMGMPRKSRNGDEFKPYSPAAALPYAHHWRLFRTPNDAFLTANTHREGISPFDILQPSYAGLYSGAVHPSAEAHAIVADHVLLHVRAILDQKTKLKFAPAN